MITFNIATVLRRRPAFLKVLKSLSLQSVPCDKINIAMSYGHDQEIKDFVTRNFRSHSIIHGSFSCEKKLFAFDKQLRDSYFLTFDDDIAYPPDYSKILIAGIEKYDRKAVIGFHGMKFTAFPVTDFYKQRKLHQYFEYVGNDCKLDIIGTGVCGFYVGTLKKKGFSCETLNTQNMTDDVLSKFCRDNSIEMICLGHKSQWLRIMPGTQDHDCTWRVAHRNNHTQNLKLLNADTAQDKA